MLLVLEALHREKKRKWIGLKTILKLQIETALYGHGQDRLTEWQIFHR